MKQAWVIGNSDGIGLETTRQLLECGWDVVGFSRRASPIEHARYTHATVDVATPAFGDALRTTLDARGDLDCVIYCAGIGDWIDVRDLTRDRRVFEVNLMGAIVAAEVIIPRMLAAGRGHFVVISSLADDLLSDRAPSYNASKAALSSYFAGLGLTLRFTGVAVSVIRFGFVDTKMAKASMRPFMISKERAARVVMRTLASRRARVSDPWRMGVLVSLMQGAQRMASWFR